MKRANSEGSIRQRTNGSWEARVSLPNGHRKSFYGARRVDVQQQLMSAQRDIQKGVGYKDAPETVEEYLLAWLSSVHPSIRPSTFRVYSGFVHDHLIVNICSAVYKPLEHFRGAKNLVLA